MARFACQLVPPAGKKPKDVQVDVSEAGVKLLDAKGTKAVGQFAFGSILQWSLPERGSFVLTVVAGGSKHNVTLASDEATIKSLLAKVDGTARAIAGRREGGGGGGSAAKSQRKSKPAATGETSKRADER